ncbi:beta-1,3-galactosyltransferase 5-like isoform X1 [Clavelina lepadiformis]|uniref:beta-1,3-galactosyltransferase 5-like isoform X1 n=2 Tax=Clavelina lepadiformis TaxID=159417 RepID=UPI004042196F
MKLYVMKRRNILPIIVVFVFISFFVSLVPLLTLMARKENDKSTATKLKSSIEEAMPNTLPLPLRLPNDHNIHFLKEPLLSGKGEHHCSNGRESTWTMVTFVKSTATNFDRRNLLRSTWASLKKIENRSLFTVFVIGKTDSDVQALIDEEHETYHDILQITKTENYHNIGFKTLAGMKWASENLPSNYYYSTSDDDMWIDMLKVKELIDHYRGVVVEKEWPEFPIICTYKWWNGSLQPIRTPTDKNYVSKEQYPWPYWPAFCFGGMYTTSVSVIKQLWELSAFSKTYYNADDVWITGLLRHRLGMPNEMMIRPDQVVAKHYHGFENNDVNVTHFEQWDELRQKTDNITC